MELSFSSVKESSRALQSATAKSLVHLVREAVLALHGDYGLACVKQSLNGRNLPLQCVCVWSMMCMRPKNKANYVCSSKPN